MKRIGRFLLTALALVASGVGPLGATETKIFETQSAAGFLAGTLDGVAVDPVGRLVPAPRVDRVASLAEPFVFALAPRGGGSQGWIVGTGNSGKVLSVDAKGKINELLTTAEPSIFAVWVDPDGTAFVGSSPNGKVYRIAADGRSEVWFDPQQVYIWRIARATDGSLWVATGTDGKLFRVTGKNEGTVVLDTEDAHIRSLLPLPNGEFLVGTAGGPSGRGLVLRVGKGGSVRAIYDATQPEVAALALAPDGTIYAALIASEASLIDEAKGNAAAKPEARAGEGSVVVTVEGEAPTAQVGGKERGPRSELVALTLDGEFESLWTSNDETLYDLLWLDGLWVATGQEGKLYRLRSQRLQLEYDAVDRQLAALAPPLAADRARGFGPTIASSNGSAISTVSSAPRATGTYTSTPFDAGGISRFGVFRWRGEAPKGSKVTYSFRSGVSAIPDRTWSDWTAGKNGREIALEVPAARYVQWRAQLEGEPQIDGIELTYRQQNLRPKIEAFGALTPGQILVPANFNPGNQVYEPTHPNRDGIFTTLSPSSERDDSGRLKPLWKLGTRTLRWKANDPNGDTLRYRLSFRPAAKDGAWLPLADDLEDDHYSFDIAVLPDGEFRFRLEALDEKANAPGEGMIADEVSEVVVVDHSVPVLGRVERKGDRLEVEISDAWSPLREVNVSVGAKGWQSLRVSDGLLDGQRETVSIPFEKERAGKMVLLRVVDAAYNAVTFDLSTEIR